MNWLLKTYQRRNVNIVSIPTSLGQHLGSFYTLFNSMCTLYMSNRLCHCLDSLSTVYMRAIDSQREIPCVNLILILKWLKCKHIHLTDAKKIDMQLMCSCVEETHLSWPFPAYEQISFGPKIESLHTITLVFLSQVFLPLFHDTGMIMLVLSL